MSILGINKNYRKAIITYSIVSVFLIVFTLIYESMSYGENSIYMRSLAFITFILGIGYYILLSLFSFTDNRLRNVLWNSGVVVLANGFLIKAIIEISGRISEYEMFYYIIAGSLFILSFIVEVKNRLDVKKIQNTKVKR